LVVRIQRHHHLSGATLRRDRLTRRGQPCSFYVNRAPKGRLSTRFSLSDMLCDRQLLSKLVGSGQANADGRTSASADDLLMRRRRGAARRAALRTLQLSHERTTLTYAARRAPRTCPE
jgi:hypothetical protein